VLERMTGIVEMERPKNGGYYKDILSRLLIGDCRWLAFTVGHGKFWWHLCVTVLSRTVASG